MANRFVELNARLIGYCGLDIRAVILTALFVRQKYLDKKSSSFVMS
jgi:hypothetical protein